MLFKARQGLDETIGGAVFPDHAIALSRGGEVHSHGDASLAARCPLQFLEGDDRFELHWLDVFAAAVAIDDALRPYDLFIVMRFW
jgi:hypothetical protein